MYRGSQPLAIVPSYCALWHNRWHNRPGAPELQKSDFFNAQTPDTSRDFKQYISRLKPHCLQLWERDKMEMRRRLLMHKNMERKVKNLKRGDQKIHKELQVLDKRIVLPSGEDNGLSAVYQSETSKSVSAQTNLQLVFEAIERFTAASLNACEELLQRIEEDKVSREQENVS
ncbi:hypothetical protein L6452_12849 [Arctium lappa]|uniref:Uncharacterized protein n=1 Tax=Arctium lappa TaxID=4217 RepID=A0ACB9CGN1_ARCLA|nr:hypothetical protein L6452_12849 [Arctium lappa]